MWTQMSHLPHKYKHTYAYINNTAYYLYMYSGDISQPLPASSENTNNFNVVSV